MALLESGEMYLETILLLKRKKPLVKAVDIVEELDYSKSSVSRGVHLLEESGLITIDVNGAIEFTKEGLDYTRSVYEKHRILTEFFVKLGVGAQTAENDACRIEHVISGESFEAIKKYLGEK